MKQCSICGYHRYCSEECRSFASLRHKAECNAQGLMSKVIVEANTPSIAILAEDDALLHLLVALFCHIDVLKRSCQHEELTALFAMTTNRAAFNDEHIQCMMVVTKLLQKVLPSTTSDDVINMICREECNSFGYRDDSNELYAYALIPLASKFNHSCDPNIVKVASGGRFSFLSNRDIKAGSDCFISYAPLDVPVKERHEILSGFMFVCSCYVCEHELEQMHRHSVVKV